MKVNKHKIIFGTFWQTALTYRAELVLWRIIEVAPILALVAIWHGIFQTTDQVGGFNLEQMVSYYLLGYIIKISVSEHFEGTVAKKINSGEFSQHLLRPLSFFKLQIVSSFSWRSLNTLISTLPLVVIFSALGLFSFSSLTTSPISWVIFFFCLIFAIIIEVLLSFLIVCFAFFSEQSHAMSHAKWISNSLLAGELLPLSLYPQSAQKIIRLLPFQFKFSTPVEILLGQTQPSFQIVGVGVFWVLALTTLLFFTWKISIKKYTAVGG